MTWAVVTGHAYPEYSYGQTLNDYGQELLITLGRLFPHETEELLLA